MTVGVFVDMVRHTLKHIYHRDFAIVVDEPTLIVDGVPIKKSELLAASRSTKKFIELLMSKMGEKVKQ